MRFCWWELCNKKGFRLTLRTPFVKVGDNIDGWLELLHWWKHWEIMSLWELINFKTVKNVKIFHFFIYFKFFERAFQMWNIYFLLFVHTCCFSFVKEALVFTRAILSTSKVCRLWSIYQKRDIDDCNWTRAHNHLVCKWTFFTN